MALIGFIVWYTLTAKQNITKTLSSVSSTNPGVFTAWKKYSSDSEGISLLYPPTWYLSTEQLGGAYPLSLIRLQSAPSSKTNDFGLDIETIITPTPSTPFNTYPNGNSSLLSNGITLWQEKASETFATGSVIDKCPSLKIGTDNSYSLKLKSGKYLTINGSFCWAQGLSNTNSYTVQIDSPEWRNAIAVINSIQQL